MLFRSWIEREQPEYNKTVLEHTTNSFDNKKSYREGKRKWGYNRKKKPSNKRTNTIKCRNLETGKIKTFHGWAEAAAFIGRGKYTQDIIIRSVKNGHNAYGYKWWVHKKIQVKTPVYGIHKNGHVTQVFESIYEAMRSFGEEDKGKGICTSIKWGSRWKGYLWYKADTLE